MGDYDDDECSCCGSAESDRIARAKQYPGEEIPTGLIDCQFCGSKKCCICDMGDDVECANCGDAEP